MSIFKDLGINFSKEPKEIQETKKLIKESEDKRDALVQALNQEEDRIIASNKEHFIIIGEYVYNNYHDVKTSGFSEEVEKSYQFIKDNEEKLKSIALQKEDVKKRYDGEIDILRLNLKKFEAEQVQQQVQQEPAPFEEEPIIVEGDVKFCHNCGTKNNIGAKFCANCGVNIE